MVKYKHIIEAMDVYVSKCSNKEISSKLGKLSQEEKNEKLETLLNPAEKEHYERLQKNIGECERAIDDIENMDEDHKEWWGEDWINSNINRLNEEIEETKQEIFNYEKRIIQGYTPREPKEVQYDISNYNMDKQYSDDDISAENYQKQMGKIEKAQIKAQAKISFTETEEECLASYFGAGSRELNKVLNNDGIIKENQVPTVFQMFGDEKTPNMKEMSDNLSSAIQKTSLKEDTIVFHGGHFDIKSVVGDEINFKGFTSCSFV